MDDLISRQTIMNAFAEYVRRSNNSDFAPVPRWNDAVEIVENLPSADVQPVQHGKWIKAQRKGIISYADGYAECNKCHEVSYLGWNDKYCRNCGARMDGE